MEWVWCRLVDYQGGVANAVALVKQAANIPPTQQVPLLPRT